MKVSFYLSESRNIRDGITHYAKEIIQRLPKDDNQYQGIVYLSLKDDVSQMKAQFEENFPNIEIKFVKTIFPKLLLFKPFQYKLPIFYRQKVNDRADVKIFFSNFLPKCKLNGKKIVVIHDLTPLYDDAITEKQRKKILKAYIYAAKSADLVFTDSQFSKNEILKYCGIDKNKIVVSYCGIDYVKFSAPVDDKQKELIRKKYKLPDKFIFFTGQARKNKNLENLINGYAAINEVIRNEYKLVISNHNDSLSTLVDSLKLNDDVILLDGFEEDEKVALYQMSSVGVLISTSEGFGISLIEAMAAGVPTLSSNVSCLPEVVDGASYAVDPYNVQEIAQGIKELLTNENLRGQLIEKGKLRAKNFTWESTVNRLIKGISSL